MSKIGNIVPILKSNLKKLEFESDSFLKENLRTIEYYPIFK